MAYYPEEKVALIVLANQNGTVTGKMTMELAAVMHGETVSVSVPKEIALPDEVLSRYAGTYEFPGYSLVIIPERSHLIARFDDGSTIPFFAASETKFFSKVWDIQFEFSKNDKGEFASVTRHQNGEDTKGAKK
jgi:hypothetical protein